MVTNNKILTVLLVIINLSLFCSIIIYLLFSPGFIELLPSGQIPLAFTVVGLFLCCIYTFL